MSATLAVIFDMDGVILDTEPLAVRAWLSAAAEIGYPLTEQLCHDVIGLGMREARAYLKEKLPKTMNLRALELSADSHYRALIEQGVRCKDGLQELIRFLENECIPKAIATSSHTTSAKDKLQRSGVLRHFDTIVGGEQVSRGKPAPDIYLLAAQRLGVAALKCVVLEDSGPGITAAAAAGMRPIFVPDLYKVSSETERLAFAKARSLAEVIPILQALT